MSLPEVTGPVTEWLRIYATLYAEVYVAACGAYVKDRETGRAHGMSSTEPNTHAERACRVVYELAVGGHSRAAGGDGDGAG